ncbi:MAG: hypothetical protein M1281_08940 [Chloroflexi bacterium]|nr:hypothetical protein [Chloroflexota bacterium]
MGNTILNIIFQIAGIFFIASGLAGHIGLWKGWYWLSRHLIYGYIPFGVLLILASFDAQFHLLLPAADDWVPTAIYSVLFVLGVGATIWPPQWLKPAWIREIEAQPRYVYRTMVHQINAGVKWRDKVNKPRGLETWMREIHRQHSPKKK